MERGVAGKVDGGGNGAGVGSMAQGVGRSDVFRRPCKASFVVEFAAVAVAAIAVAVAGEAA